MSNEILKIFEGLTTQEVKELTQRIVPALETLRAEIVSKQLTERKPEMKLPEEERLEKIKEDNQKRKDSLNSQIYARMAKGLDYIDLQADLSKLETTAARSEELAQRRLDDAQRVQKEKADREAADRARIAADIDQKRKTAAARVWVGQGGDLQEFEASWPAIRAELMKTAVIQEAADRQQRTTIVGRSL